MNWIDLREQLDRKTQAFFRFRRLGDDRTLLTNLEGAWQIPSDDELRRYATGSIEAGSDLERRLSENDFLRATYDEAKAREMLAKRSRFLGYGPNLHVI